jgi:DNA polymerase-3 subunit gamma/tau
MRINEILTESQLQQLEEGPKLDAFGRGVGQAVGGFAKGVGAVAGGVRGAFTALKKGYQSGKAVVGDDPDPNAGKPGYTAPRDPADQAPAPSTTTPPSAADINAQGPEGSAPAKPQTGDAGKALAKSTAVVDKQQAQNQEKANQTVYAQVKANVDKLDKKGKQRILQMLQKSMSAPAPKAPAAPAGGAAGAGAMGQMANQLAGQKPNTMANAPVSATNTAKPGNPNLAQPAAAPAADAAAPATTPAAPATTPAATATKAKGGRVKGAGPSMTPDAIRKRASREAAAAKAKAGNAAMGGMANQLQQQNAGKDNYGNALSEALAQRVEMHKQKMFETGLARGTVSVFRK